MTLERRALVDAIAQQHEREPFSGVISVRRGGDVVVEAAFGLANRAERLPNRVATRFGIASGTKTLTAIAVARLVEQGRLTFDMRLADCLDAPLPAIHPGVTLHHLLSHSSGVPDYFDEDVTDDFEALWRERPMYAVRTPSDFLPLFAHLPMRALPGARWAYCNAGYILLGLAVEWASGTSYTTFVEREILQPAGMASSGFFALDRLPGGTAYGYLPTGDGGWRTNAYAIPIVGGPDGGMFTTAHDVARLWDALLGGRLAGAATLARMLTPHWRIDAHGDADADAHGAADADGDHYGYGVVVERRHGRPDAYAMVGEDPGVYFRARFDPGSGVQTSLFGNDVDAADAMHRAIEPLLRGAGLVDGARLRRDAGNGASLP